MLHPSPQSSSRPLSQRLLLTAIASVCIVLYSGWHLIYSSKRGLALSTEPKHVSCRTARGIEDPYEEVNGYHGLQTPGYSRPIMGLDTLLGDPSVCYMGHSRLGPYGSGEEDLLPNSGKTAPSRVNWADVNWGKLQAECFESNRELYRPDTVVRSKFVMPSEFTDEATNLDQSDHAHSTSPSTKARKAIIFRSWAGYEYKGSILPYLRSLITELSLKSGGEYEVFLLAEVKNKSLDIHSDPDLYDALLEQSVPAELRDITLLWTEALLEAWYPKVPAHDVVIQMYQLTQIFSKLRPDFDFFWQFELDSRIIGDTRGALDNIGKWAKAQPRKHLWERNAGFYIPEIHQSYENYSDLVEGGVNGIGVWGPATSSDISPIGPLPPAFDNPEASQWGIGEEADLITLMPMVDSRGIEWIFSDLVGSFMDGLFTARRAAPVAMTRCSKRLLHAIHDEQVNTGKWMPSEATPETFALLLGLKGVYAPHPMYVDGDWTPEEMNKLFNAGPASNLGGGEPSIYKSEYIHQDIFQALTWWWPIPFVSHDHFPKKIWQGYLAGDCVPQMLLHPLKL